METLGSFARQTASEPWRGLPGLRDRRRARRAVAVLDPNHVIRWATRMAENQPPATEPAVSEFAARMPQNFAKIMASMMEARPEGLASRN